MRFLILCLCLWSFAYAQRPSDTPPFEPGVSYSPVIRFESFKDFTVGLEISGVTEQSERITTELAAGPNPEEQFVSAGFLYERPFIDLSFSNPATLRVFARSDFTQRYPLTAATPERVRTFTERLSQFGVGVAQPLGSFELGLEGRVVGSEAFLERVEGGAESDPVEAGARLPEDALSVLFEVNARYDKIAYIRRDEADAAPVSGGAVEAALGYGVGRAEEPLSWAQIQVASRGYLSFSTRDFSVRSDRRLTLVGQLSAGTNVGRAPVWRRLAPALRGYDDFDLVGERYADGALDLRYYTEVDAALGGASFLRDLTPYLFAEAGQAWGERNYRAPELGDGVQIGFGAGAQVALETRLFTLPLNFWYARGSGGKFGFEVSYLY